MNSETAFAMINNTHKDSTTTPVESYDDCLGACHEDVTRSPPTKPRDERRISAIGSIQMGLSYLLDNLKDDNKDGLCRCEDVSDDFSSGSSESGNKTLQQRFQSTREHKDERFSS